MRSITKPSNMTDSAFAWYSATVDWVKRHGRTEDRQGRPARYVGGAPKRKAPLRVYDPAKRKGKRQEPPPGSYDIALAKRREAANPQPELVPRAASNDPPRIYDLALARIRAQAQDTQRPTRLEELAKARDGQATPGHARKAPRPYDVALQQQGSAR